MCVVHVPGPLHVPVLVKLYKMQKLAIMYRKINYRHSFCFLIKSLGETMLVPLEGAFFKNGICDSFVENFKDSDFCQEKTPTLKQFTVRAVPNYGASMYLRIIEVRTLSKYQYQYFNRKCNTVAPSN